MKTVLLTGGRAPATLDLARHFHAAGHRVVMAESMRWPLCRTSRAVARTVRVPPPRQEPAAFLEALVALVRRERVDLIVPTCEETFYVARGCERLLPWSRVFVAPFERLRVYHSKWAFIQRARRHGLAVPETRLVTDRAEVLALLEQGDELVFKPEFSRFAVETILRPRAPREVAALRLNETRRWVAQAFVAGTPLCTYSVVHEGRLTAHSAYRTAYTAGRGAGVVMQPVVHPASYHWVQQFVEHERYTGQLAFDFIEREDGGVVALECNPRATSGVHLFHDQPDLARAFFDPTMELLTPSSTQATMLTVPAILYGLRSARSMTAVRRWLRTLRTSRDAVFSRRDPWPWLLQGLSVINLLGWSLRHRVSLLEAATLDIEWNGEEG